LSSADSCWASTATFNCTTIHLIISLSLADGKTTHPVCLWLAL
jgi:hypothetical protein